MSVSKKTILTFLPYISKDTLPSVRKIIIYFYNLSLKFFPSFHVTLEWKNLVGHVYFS